MIINKRALEKLVILNTSCKVFGEKKTANTRHLIDFTRRLGGPLAEVDYQEMVHGLPESSHTYTSFKAYAKLAGYDKIDVSEVYPFFMGIRHIDFAMEQSAVLELAKEQGQEFADKFVFSHLLIDVILHQDESGIWATYRNGDVHVILKGLLPHPWLNAKIVPGKAALIHLATIVDVDISSETQKSFEIEQARSQEFMEVAGRVKEIDYRSFWNVSDWTLQLWKDLF